MVVAINLIFCIIAIIGSVMCVGLAFWVFKNDIDGIFDIIFGSAIGIIGLVLTIFLGITLYDGFTGEVNFTMKNKDGKVIEKTVRPIEYRHDGNCFLFANDSNNYCGWEVNYQKKRLVFGIEE